MHPLRLVEISKEGQTVTVEFHQSAPGNLVIREMGPKRPETVPLEGRQVRGQIRQRPVCGRRWGALSSNGIYYSDSTGKVILSEITGTGGSN